jgi:hypothetical protein
MFAAQPEKAVLYMPLPPEEFAGSARWQTRLVQPSPYASAASTVLFWAHPPVSSIHAEVQIPKALTLNMDIQQASIVSNEEIGGSKAKFLSGGSHIIEFDFQAASAFAKLIKGISGISVKRSEGGNPVSLITTSDCMAGTRPDAGHACKGYSDTATARSQRR